MNHASESLACWRCGAALKELPLPLGRLDECPKCRAQLHVCKMCAFYDARLAKGCREKDAEDIADKQHANFCGYFKASPTAWRAPDAGRVQAAKAQVDALFGGAPAETPRDPARERAEALFRGPDKK